MEMLEKANDALANAAPDPNRLWNNLSGGGKLMGILALTLHGIGDAFAGTNTQDPLSKAVDRDIEQQKAQFESRKQALSNKFSFYKAYREAGLSDLEAAAEAKAKTYELLSNRLDDTLQGAKNQTMIANGEKAKAAIQQGYLKAKEEGETHRANIAHVNAQTYLANLQAQAAGAKGAGFDPKLIVVLPDGRVVRAASEEDAKKIKEGNTTSAAYKKAVADTIEAGKGIGVVDRAAAALGINTPAMTKFNDVAGTATDLKRAATTGSTAEPSDSVLNMSRQSFQRNFWETPAEYEARLRASAAMSDVPNNARLQSMGYAPIVGTRPR